MRKIFGIISLLCGIFGFFAWYFICLVFPLCLYFFTYYYLPGAAIIFGVIGSKYDDSEVLSIIGIILGFIGIFTLPVIIQFVLLALYD